MSTEEFYNLISGRDYRIIPLELLANGEWRYHEIEPNLVMQQWVHLPDVVTACHPEHSRCNPNNTYHKCTTTGMVSVLKPTDYDFFYLFISYVRKFGYIGLIKGKRLFSCDSGFHQIFLEKVFTIQNFPLFASKRFAMQCFKELKNSRRSYDMVETYGNQFLTWMAEPLKQDPEILRLLENDDKPIERDENYDSALGIWYTD